MKRLSAEVISIIFKYLHYKQKLECMLVCKSWANILSSGLDIETIAITKPSKNTFIPFLDKIKSLEGYGRHCKRLVIDESSPHVFDYIALATYFPNLNHLLINGDDETEDPQLQLQEQNRHHSINTEEEGDNHYQPPSWRTHLKVAKILKYNRRFLYYLEVGLFQSLETLVLSPCNDFSYRFLTDTFQKLKHAPHIKEFSIERLHIDICDLEQLHHSLPKLLSLTLKKCFLHCERSVPIDIQPALTLKTLKILDFFPTFDVTSSIPQYLIFKYNHVQHLVMKTPMYSEGRFDQLATDATSFIRAMGQHLTHLELHLAFKTPRFFDIFHKVRLKHLTARLFLSKRVLNKLVSLDGLKFIQTLRLSQVPHLDFSVFKRFMALEELELEFKEKRGAKFKVELDTILQRDLPRNLMSLGLGYVELNIHDPKGGQIGLRQLKLNRAEVSEDLPAYIDGHVKALRNLLLYDCKIKGDRFLLPNHRLHLVHLFLSTELSYSATGYAYEEGYENPVNLQLEMDAWTRYYRPPQKQGRNRAGLALEVNPSAHDHPMQRTCEPEAFNENKKYFRFKCMDVQTIYFNRYLVL